MKINIPKIEYGQHIYYFHVLNIVQIFLCYKLTLEIDVMHLDKLTPYNVIPLEIDSWYLYKETALVYEGQSNINIVWRSGPDTITIHGN